MIIGYILRFPQDIFPIILVQNPWLLFQGANVFSNCTILGLELYKHSLEKNCSLLVFNLSALLLNPFPGWKDLVWHLYCFEKSSIYFIFLKFSLPQGIWNRQKIEIKCVPFCTIPNTPFHSAWNLVIKIFTNYTAIRILVFKILTKNYLLSYVESTASYFWLSAPNFFEVFEQTNFKTFWATWTGMVLAMAHFWYQFSLFVAFHHFDNIFFK